MDKEYFTWHESFPPSSGYPAHIILAVIRDSPYPVSRHSAFDIIGTVTSCRVFESIPDSVKRKFVYHSYHLTMKPRYLPSGIACCSILSDGMNTSAYWRIYSTISPYHRLPSV